MRDDMDHTFQDIFYFFLYKDAIPTILDVVNWRDRKSHDQIVEQLCGEYFSRPRGKKRK